MLIVVAVVVDDHAVNDHFDRVTFIPAERDRLVQIPDLAIDPRANEPSSPDLVEDTLMLPLAIRDKRGQDHQPGSLREGLNLRGHLLHRLLGDRPSAGGAVGMADPGEQEPEVIVNLGHGSHGGARVPAGALLIDRDGGREAVDLVDVRLFHQAEELPGIGGE